MKTYFVVSDIHGFYTPLLSALEDAGYDKNDSNHILIVLGDIFDRGKEPLEVYHFLRSIPSNRIVLVKGNHEYLLEELIDRKMPYNHDFHNGTYQTLIDLYKDPFIEKMNWLNENRDKYDDITLVETSRRIYREVEEALYDNDIINEILSWISSSIWHHYYELGKYIFVHSFIPLEDRLGPKRYIHNWRECKDEYLWYNSTWGCPYELYLEGYFKEEERKGKVLVCGHWHTSDFFNHLLYKNDKSKWLDYHESNPLFISKKYPGIIAIDGCVAATNKVNVLVIKEEDL